MIKFSIALLKHCIYSEDNLRRFTKKNCEAGSDFLFY
jgi:hypothetical protein